MGRDKGRYYIVTKVIDSYFVYVSDGFRKKVTDPKRKSIKHLDVIDTEMILSDALNADDKIKKHLECHVKEV